jgi:outer membrane protein assembly factor BamE (lipoprotein component of BamABCDE complex)
MMFYHRFPCFAAMRWFLWFAVLGLASLALLGCASTEHANYNRPLAADTLAQVSVGMSEDELRQVMGSPTLVDQFHPNLLVYLFIDPKTQAPWQAFITLTPERKVSKIDTRLAQNVQ